MEKKVEIYIKDWCGYCRAATRLLDQLQWRYEIIDVTHDQQRYREMVDRAKGRTSVPQIFIDDRGIGGYTELSRMVHDSSRQNS